jgi:hypothetical protein
MFGRLPALAAAALKTIAQEIVWMVERSVSIPHRDSSLNLVQRNRLLMPVFSINCGLWRRSN